MENGGDILITCTGKLMKASKSGAMFGQCIVDYAGDLAQRSFKHVFTLPNPTLLRCTVMATIMALEDVSSSFSGKRPVLIVRNDFLIQIFKDKLFEKWDSRGWPKGSIRSTKPLLERLMFKFRELDATIMRAENKENSDVFVDLEHDPVKDSKQDAAELMQNQEKGELLQQELARSKMAQAAFGEALPSLLPILKRQRRSKKKRSAKKKNKKKEGEV